MAAVGADQYTWWSCHVVQIGQFNARPRKAIRIFQQRYSLPITGEADQATMQKINEELTQRGLTIS